MFHRLSAALGRSLTRPSFWIILALATVVLPRPASPRPWPAQAAPLSAADRAAIRSLLPPLEQTYLKASNPRHRDYFGTAIAIEGDTVVIGGVNTDAAYVFVRTAAGWSQQAILTPSNPQTGDYFGSIVALSGDTIVVGAPMEDSNATGVDGNQDDNSATNAGAAYVFTRSGGAWTQQAYLKASNTEAEDWFGIGAGIDGDIAVIGAIYESSNATGVNGDQQDNSVSQSGAAYVFERVNGVWTQRAYLKGDVPDIGGILGRRVAVSGTTIVAGGGGYAEDSGRAFVFEKVNGSWVPQATLMPASGRGGKFGYGVAIDGDTIVIGAYLNDSAATGVNGDPLNTDAPSSGAAYVFTRSADVWSQQAYLKASNTNAGDHFGEEVAIDGNTIMVGAMDEDSAATSINGDQQDNSLSSAGAAYVFMRTGTSWSQQAYLKASNTEASDLFGIGVAVDGETMLVGALGEDSNATGINGDQQDNSLSSAGAAYVFAGSLPVLPTPTATAVPTSTVPAGSDDSLIFLPLLLR